MVANRQSVTLGNAAARSRSIAPRWRRNRQIERKALTMLCAYRGLIVRACRITNVVIVDTVRAPKSKGPLPNRSLRNRRKTST